MTARYSESREAFLIAWRDQLTATIATGVSNRDLVPLSEQLLTVITELNEIAPHDAAASQSAAAKRGMKPVRLGATGLQVATQVAELRTRRGLTYGQLSSLLDAAGCPIPELGLRRIENRARRVSVDELVALAKVFRVPPAHLYVLGGDDMDQEKN